MYPASVQFCDPSDNEMQYRTTQSCKVVVRGRFQLIQPAYELKKNYDNINYVFSQQRWNVVH